jgi:hypothetical protein
VAVSFVGGGYPSSQRKPLTCRKSLTNFIKTDCHDLTELLLKVALNTINQTKPDNLCLN